MNSDPRIGVGGDLAAAALLLVIISVTVRPYEPALAHAVAVTGYCLMAIAAARLVVDCIAYAALHACRLPSCSGTDPVLERLDPVRGAARHPGRVFYGRLLIGDDDREAVIARLRDHFVAGRLELDELRDRAELVLTAVYASDAAATLADLPPGIPWLTSP